MNFGTGSFLPAGPTVHGSAIVPPGQQVLVPVGAGSATGVGIALGGASGGSLLFERGTVATAIYYDLAFATAATV